MLRGARCSGLDKLRLFLRRLGAVDEAQFLEFGQIEQFNLLVKPLIVLLVLDDLTANVTKFHHIVRVKMVCVIHEALVVGLEELSN